MDIYQILRVRKNADKSELQAKYLRLIDTYQMTATFAEEQEIADIAQNKLNRLLSAGKECGLYSECPESDTVNTPQTNISLIKLALNSSRSDASKLKGSNISGKIDLLPESAEKHYLKAIVTLRLDSSFQGCQTAVLELHNAIKMDPTNEAYTGLLDAVSEQIKDYEQRQRQKAAQDERERQDRERQSAAAVAAAQRRRFWSSAGPCLGGLGGIAATICACWCVIECFKSSGCGDCCC